MFFFNKLNFIYVEKKFVKMLKFYSKEMILYYLMNKK